MEVNSDTPTELLERRNSESSSGARRTRSRASSLRPSPPRLELAALPMSRETPPKRESQSSARLIKSETLGEEMSTCLLQQSRFCVFGVIAGMPFSVRARSYWPFISLGIAGMGADLLWGLLAPKEFYGCREVCEAYRKHVRGAR